MNFEHAARELRGLKPSLNDMEKLPCELIDWLKSKELSVRQAKDLLVLTKTIIDKTWRTEERKVML